MVDGRSLYSVAAELDQCVSLRRGFEQISDLGMSGDPVRRGAKNGEAR